MCGIAGIVRFDGKSVEPRRLAEMLNSLGHRGPDDQGFVLADPKKRLFLSFHGADSSPETKDKYPPMPDIPPAPGLSIGLGQVRFSIIDTSNGGHQPFMDQSGSCCLIFNGELYNYLEIRAELLALGRKFLTNSDTEVIIEAYRQWGTDCFKKFNGVWSLALWDRRDGSIILSRDRLGKLPLYWRRKGNSILFASEIRSLFSEIDINQDMKVNHQAIYPWIVFGLRDFENSTFYEGVQTLPAATWCRLTPDFPANQTTYWVPPKKRFSERQIDPKEASQELRRLLSEAISIRLRADVPVAFELSGGMDSSAMVALGAQISDQPLTTYTVRFNQPQWNEAPIAAAVARKWKTNHHELDIPGDTFWQEIDPFTLLAEEPYHAPNVHTNQMVRRKMRDNGAKVLITGSAGDELFAGYREYFDPCQRELALQGHWQQYRNNTSGWTEINARGQGRKRPLIQAPKLILKRALERLGIRRENHSYLKGAPRQAQETNPLTLSSVLFLDLFRNKVPYWLRIGDKIRMGIPIEARMPFLDYRVVEFALSLPVGFLIRDGWHKWILRKAMEDLLPQEVVWRREKMGFPFPIEKFQEQSKPLIQHIFKVAQNPFVELKETPVTTKNWRFISYLLWYERFFNKNHSLFDHLKLNGGQNAPTYLDGIFQPHFLSSHSRG